MQEQIGNAVKQIRLSQGITLQQLAEKTNQSISYLSMLERGLNSPTIASLQKICAALHITFNELLSNLSDAPLVVHKNERRMIYEEKGHVLYEAITEGQRNIRSICMTVYDDAEHQSEQHIADEFGFIVSGSMEMCLNGIRYALDPGDSLYIPANNVHSFRKTSIDVCVSVWSYHNIAVCDQCAYPMGNRQNS